VPARIEKVLSADKTDLSDEQNRAAAFKTEGPGQWLMSGYTGHVSATLLCTHAARMRDAYFVVATVWSLCDGQIVLHVPCNEASAKSLSSHYTIVLLSAVPARCAHRNLSLVR
jgi:hypothetical protein